MTPMKVGSRRTGAAMHFKAGWKYMWVLAWMKVNVGESRASVLLFDSSLVTEELDILLHNGRGWGAGISGTWFCILTIARSFPQSPHPKTLCSHFCGWTKAT